MLTHDEMQAANDNSLNREAALSLRLLHWFLESREEAIAELIGPGYRPDSLRDELMRSVCLHFSHGHVRDLVDYQQDLASRHAAPSVAAAFEVLALVHLVTIDHDAPVGSAKLIKPTKRLISFYNKNMPAVLSLARKMLHGMMLPDSQA